MERIHRCDFTDEGKEVDRRLRIGAIGNGPDHGKRDAEFKTDLGNGGAFHLDGEQIGKMAL